MYSDVASGPSFRPNGTFGENSRKKLRLSPQGSARRGRTLGAVKVSTLLLLLAMQAAFILYGLAATFWTLNEWLADERLNALFGGFMLFLAFLIGWRLSRRWVRRRFGLGSGR